MDTYSLMVPNFIPKDEYLDARRHQTCIGCGVLLAVRLAGKVLKKDMAKAVSSRDAGQDLFGVDTAVQFLRIKKGRQELVLGLDDEPADTLDAATEKRIPAIAIAQGYSYVATASPSYAFDLMAKVQRALDAPGNAYIHILCPCPSAWQFSTEDTVKMGNWAVESLTFPLYEAVGGYYNLTIKTLSPRKIDAYITAQGRFQKVTARQIENAQAAIEKNYRKLEETIEGQLAYSEAVPVY